jgi:hypothetical protein
MSKSPANNVGTSHSGIPRTHAAAKKLGAMPSKLTYNALPDTHKAQFMLLAHAGARAGSLCGIGPSTDPTKVLVCYKNELGKCHWIEWPKGQTPPSHE